MKISIITVVLNDYIGLKRTVESLRVQTCMDFEYIIIDGGSVDGTQEYLKTLSQQEWCQKVSFQYRSGKDTGIYNAMNKGVALAHGEFCLFLNAGDTLYNNSVIERVVCCLDEADIYTGHTKFIDRNAHNVFAPEQINSFFFYDKTLAHPSSFIRTTLLRAQPYNENNKIVSDWEFFLIQYMSGARYQKLNFFISDFYLGGISSNLQLDMNERSSVLKTMYPDFLLKEYESMSKLGVKVSRAFALSPIQRDWKILRNAFKALMRDLF